MILAVLPAPDHVRLDKLAAERESLVRLATEQEFSNLFRLRAGRHAAFRLSLQLAVYVDGRWPPMRRFLRRRDARDAIRMRYDDFVNLAKPRSARSLRRGDLNADPLF